MNSHPEVATEIAQCEARLLAAQFASDVSELDTLIADEILFVGLDGQLATKAMDLEAHRQRALRLSHSALQEQQIRVLSPEVAVAISWVELRGSYLGEPFEGNFRYTRIWQKGAHGWQIVAGHMSQIATPPSYS